MRESGRDLFHSLRDHLGTDHNLEMANQLLDEVVCYLSGDTLRALTEHFKSNYDINDPVERECRYCEATFTVDDDDSQELDCSETCTSLYEDELSEWASKTATAICTVNPLAGSIADGDNSIDARAKRLLESGPYGCYVGPGDPNGWSSGAVATIYLEAKGNGVHHPFSYYGNGMEVSFEASKLLDGAYIEFANAAVASVHLG